MSKPKRKYWEKESVNYFYVLPAILLSILEFFNVIRMLFSATAGNMALYFIDFINFFVIIIVIMWIWCEYKPTIKKVYINEETA